MQNQFIQYLKSKSQKHTSFVEEIASVLDIGYDAAYRRINLKTSLTFEEGIKLARHFDISLNNLFEVGKQDSLLTELSISPVDEQSLELWFIQAKNNLNLLRKLKSSSIFCMARNIPILHCLGDTYLTRYKMYIWLKSYNFDMLKNKVSFDDFIKTMPQSLIQSAVSLGESYRFVRMTEIWNDFTINSNLQEILYFFNSGFLSKDLALHICDDLEDIIKNLEKQTIEQSVAGSKTMANYYLYKNEFQQLNNAILIKTPHKKILFTPYLVLSYFKIENQPFCDLIYEQIRKLIINSKLLAKAGEMERQLFFNQMLNKINIVRGKIKIGMEFSFI